jgi:hypothetical protein
MAPGSLGDGAAPFRLLRHEDLPEAWLQPVDGAFLVETAARLGLPSVTPVVCIELPDYPWAWQYHRWWEQESELASQRGERPLPLMVTARDIFRGLPTEEQRRSLATQVLRSLLQDGLPLPLFARTFGPPGPRS